MISLSAADPRILFAVLPLKLEKKRIQRKAAGEAALHVRYLPFCSTQSTLYFVLLKREKKRNVCLINVLQVLLYS